MIPRETVTFRIIALSAMVLALVACNATNFPMLAMFSMGSEAPVDRLVSNVARYLKKHPENPEAYYLMGRIHALAYAEKTKTINIYQNDKDGENGDQLPRVVKYYFRRDDNAKKPDYAELLIHLAEAITNYRAAIKCAPKSALYHLSLASIIESAKNQILDADVKLELAPAESGLSDPRNQTERLEQIIKDGYFNSENMIKEGAYAVPILKKLMVGDKKELQNDAREAFQKIWREEAIQHYWLAYMLAVRTDLPERENYSLDIPVSEEAAVQYLELVRQRGPTEQESLRIPQLEKDIATLRKRGRAITPIIFSETENCPLENLLSPNRVQFDLAGDGLHEDCPWVKPDTSILVWDPKHKGNITSGRQMFGSVTWWIFWRDGYEALEALDDNGDGILSGAELHGLAVWRDVNGNGICDPGEVTPIEDTQILSIAVHSTGVASPGPSPSNAVGLRLKDGRCLPTYDWTFTRN